VQPPQTGHLGQLLNPVAGNKPKSISALRDQGKSLLKESDENGAIRKMERPSDEP